MPKKLTTEEFIKRAKDVHGDMYIYDKLEYVRAHDFVTVICPEHGEYEVRAYSHLAGFKCAKCSGLVRKGGEQFIKEAQEVHGDKYSYGKVEYTNNKKPVIVTCRKHGDFKSKPQPFLNSKIPCEGCRRDSSWENFLSEANHVHSGKYSYDRSSFSGMKKAVEICCPLHGSFSQIACAHARSQGCPKCATKYTGKETVYLVRLLVGEETFIKVGITNTDPETRFRTCQDVHLLETVATLEFKERSDAKTIEAYLHAKHKRHQFTPKVKFGGHTECFNIEALETIKQDFGV